MKTKRKLYLIGNAHLDPVWLWRWQEGFAEIKATFKSALDRMNEFPDFVFTCACASYYKWVEENCPEMFEEIKQRIAEGRWVIAGGWWVQPDCNLPSGESFVRHGLYSQRYFFEKFGRIAKAGYNVDSFGHNGMLPQILKKSGMENYVCMRPVRQENNKVTPEGPFWWESEDGSRVLTFKIPSGYGFWIPKSGSEKSVVHQKINDELKMSEDCGQDYMTFYGVGNHGGGPTIKNIDAIHEIQKELGSDVIFMSSPDEYFNDIRNSDVKLNVYKDDLQHSASLCYSANSEVKKSNRMAENRLLAAEKYAAVAFKILGLPYQDKEIEKAWQKVMFNQFHDIICGCSIKDAYDDARDSYGAALDTAAVVLNSAVQKISWAIDTMDSEEKKRSKEFDWSLWEYQNKGTPFVVFNPLSWEAEIPVQINKKVNSVTDENGNPVAVQTVRGPQTMRDNDKWNSVFVAKIPAMGYRLYWVYIEKEIRPTDSNRMLLTENYALENEWIRLEVEPHTGFVSRIFDKKNNVEVLSDKGAVPIVIDVHDCDTWAHEKFSFRKEMAKFTNAEVTLLENGPVRAKLRVVSRYNKSELIQDFILYRYKADIEVQAKLDWREKRSLLKLSFPVNITDSNATYEIPYGYINRETTGDEDPGLNWVTVNGRNNCGEYGLALLNDCKYSFDVKENEMRLTVANSSVYADHRIDSADEFDNHCEYLDQGVQQFKYVIVPFKGCWQEANIIKKAFELNTQPIQIMETYHKGSMPQAFEGLRISSNNVIATVFKRSEDNDGYVLRCYETTGKNADTTIELPLLNKKWAVKFGKCEIKTFFISDNSQADVVEKSLIEQ